VSPDENVATPVPPPPKKMKTSERAPLARRVGETDYKLERSCNINRTYSPNHMLKSGLQKKKIVLAKIRC